MKKLFSVLILLSISAITGCTDKEEVNLYATQSSHDESKALILSLRKDIDSLKPDLMKNESDIRNAVESIGELKKMELDVKTNSAFVKANTSVDLAAIESLKVKVLELENEAKEEFQQKEKVKQLIKRKTKKEQVKLNVFVSKINSWGGSLVAVINIPDQGFKTLSVYSSVGNGWSISHIDNKSVSFIHSSGHKSKVYL